ASEEMNAQAEQMKGIVGELVALVGGSGGKQVSSREYAVGRERRAIAAPKKRAKGKALTVSKEKSPENVIPMDDDFKDF
ncbi:MAG: methyl-accepting chemotaxis protein, partial [Thermodesulfobacteriota bacterium]|nr:methyl-accepting chemotaxis protein [Thermodesulfobacteriota bacterium]